MKHLKRPSRLNIDIKRAKVEHTLIDDQVEYNIPTNAIQGAIMEAILSEGIKVEHIITEALLFESN